MPELVVPAAPTRAERFRSGMTSILGRPIQVIDGVASFYPHTPACHLVDGCWAVEIVPRYILRNGRMTRDGRRVEVLSDEDFRTEYRPAGSGRPMLKPTVEE